MTNFQHDKCVVQGSAAMGKKTHVKQIVCTHISHIKFIQKGFHLDIRDKKTGRYFE